MSDEANKREDIPQAEINTLIAYFMSKIPVNMRDQLDYSLKSLNVVEGWLCERYTKEDSDAFIEEYDGWDDGEAFKPGWIFDSQLIKGSVFYIGEVYRKCLGGYWRIYNVKPNPTWEYEDYPVIEQANVGYDICPFINVTEALYQRYPDSVFLSQPLIQEELRRIKRQNTEKH